MFSLTRMLLEADETRTKECTTPEVEFSERIFRLSPNLMFKEKYLKFYANIYSNFKSTIQFEIIQFSDCFVSENLSGQANREEREKVCVGLQQVRWLVFLH